MPKLLAFNSVAKLCTKEIIKLKEDQFATGLMTRVNHSVTMDPLKGLLDYRFGEL